MSDENVIMAGDSKIHASVARAAENRAVAVEIALELAKAACAGRGPVVLARALTDLSKNADKIQRALQQKGGKKSG